MYTHFYAISHFGVVAVALQWVVQLFFVGGGGGGGGPSLGFSHRFQQGGQPPWFQHAWWHCDVGLIIARIKIYEWYELICLSDCLSVFCFSGGGGAFSLFLLCIGQAKYRPSSVLNGDSRRTYSNLLCHYHVTTMSPPCHHHVTTMSPPCHHHVTTMSPPCHHHVSTVHVRVTSRQDHLELLAPPPPV